MEGWMKRMMGKKRLLNDRDLSTMRKIIEELEGSLGREVDFADKAISRVILECSGPTFNKSAILKNMHDAGFSKPTTDMAYHLRLFALLRELSMNKPYNVLRANRDLVIKAERVVSGQMDSL